MKISIVTTLYQSESFIEEFCRRTQEAARRLAGDFEIIFVNDGSPDGSLGRVVEIAKTNERVIVVDLSRNFGHHKAIMTGLTYATGEYVFLIDSDLEEDPEWLNPFFEEMDRIGGDVVFGVQEKRKGSFFEKLSGALFYASFRALTGLDLPRNFVTARLMSRRYVDALLRFRESELFLGGIWHSVGFAQTPFLVQKKNRNGSTYTLRKKVALFINSITAFSSRPLVAISYFGAFVSLFSLAFTVYLVLSWLLWSRPLLGWTSVIASVWLLGGMIIFFVGVIGVYLSKMFIEVKDRPYTIVRNVYGMGRDGPG